MGKGKYFLDYSLHDEFDGYLDDYNEALSGVTYENHKKHRTMLNRCIAKQWENAEDLLKKIEEFHEGIRPKCENGSGWQERKQN